MLTQVDPTFRINVIPTNGDEITYTQTRPVKWIATHYIYRENIVKSLTSLTAEEMEEYKMLLMLFVRKKPPLFSYQVLLTYFTARTFFRI